MAYVQSIINEEIRRRVKIALDIFAINDRYLLENTSNEPSLSHKFAEYLQIVFRDWNVDCEYFRNIEDQGNRKRAIVPNRPRTALRGTTPIPDIIIHRRGTNAHNLLAIEVKASNDTESERIEAWDKVKAYLEQNLQYQTSLLLTFKVGDHSQEEPCYTAKWLPLCLNED